MSVISSDAGLTGLGNGNGGRPEEPGPGREVTVRELVGDRALDLLLARSKDEAGELRLTGGGSMLGGIPQRDDRQDGADRGRAGGVAGAAGPGWQLRAAAGAQAGRADRRRAG